MSSTPEVAQETEAMDVLDASLFRGTGTFTPSASVRGVARDLDSCYNMRHSRRGLALIINNNNFNLGRRVIDRLGSDRDEAMLKQCFQRLGFQANDIRIRHDLTTDDILRELNEAARYDHSDCDMLMCAILSHGEEGKVYGVDGGLAIEKLYEPFKKPQCMLAGKPKMFILQATDQSQGHIVTDAVAEHAPVMNVIKTKCSYRIPTEADFLLVYAPAYGQYSKDGTLFIQHLVEQLQNPGGREIMQIMTKVSGSVSAVLRDAAVQHPPLSKNAGLIPCVTTMLTKELYFE